MGIQVPLRVRMERAKTVSGREPTESELNHESEVDIPAIMGMVDLVVYGTIDPYENVNYIMERMYES